MKMSDKIKELKEQIDQLNIYIADLECRHDIAIDSLGYLSSGRGLVETKNENWTISMQNLARRDLVKITKMQLRTPTK